MFYEYVSHHSYSHTGLIARSAEASTIASDSALKRESERKKRGRHKSVDLRNAETYLDQIGSSTRTESRRSSMGSIGKAMTGTGMGYGLGSGSGSGFSEVNYSSNFPVLIVSNPCRSENYRDAGDARSSEKRNVKEREREMRERAGRREKEERDFEIERVRCMTMNVDNDSDPYSNCRTIGRRKSIGSSGVKIKGGVFAVIDLDATYSGSCSFKKGVSAVPEGDQYKKCTMLVKPGGGYANPASLRYNVMEEREDRGYVNHASL